jgi:hypothetical protein
MSSFCKITIGKTPGATRANALYITRTGACAQWETRNIADEEHLGITREDQRRSIADYLCEYAEQGRGERRDYRAVLSFDRPVERDQAMRLAGEWLDATKFKTNPTLYAFHTNTDNPHVHVLVTARDSAGKKLDLSDRQYQSFDKAWAKIYEREIERGGEAVHSEKHREKRQWKQQYGEQRREGKDRSVIVEELGAVPRDTPSIVKFYREKRRDDETRITESLGRESEFLQRVREDYREPEPEAGRQGGGDPATGSDAARTRPAAEAVLGSLREAEGRAGVLHAADRGVEAAEVQPQEAIRDGARRAHEEVDGGVHQAEAGLRGLCQAGDREGRGECEGEREERGGNLRQLRTRVAEGLRAGIAGRGVEAVKRAVHAIGQRIRQIPDELGIIRHEFRQWREEIWEKVTGKPYRTGIDDSGGGKGLGDAGSPGSGRKRERDRGWER